MNFILSHISSILVLLLFMPLTAFSQLTAAAEISGTGLLSTGDTLPFWQHTNTRGRISEETNFAALASAELNYNINQRSNLQAGAGIFFNNALLEDDIKVDELFLTYSFSWLNITAGRKQEQELYQGLSATNENILWSLNPRPFPGIKLKTNRPVCFTKNKKWAFEAEWAEYLTTNDRYVQDAQLHHKSFHLNYFTSKWIFKAGIQHFAFWAGNSPSWGEQPASFSDYLRVVAGREGGETALKGDQVNVLGSHLGSYELYTTRKFDSSSLTFIYNSIFEDGSGSRLANFPDGRYGLYFEQQNQNKWITGVIYELYYTKNMSQTGPHLYDSYFNNWVYASGWTNNNRIIGVPFMTTNYYEDYPLGTKTIRVGNNSVLVHHFGLTGAAFKNYPYKILASYRNNYGHYRNTGLKTFEYYSSNDPRGKFRLPPNVISTFAEVQIPVRPFKLKLQVAGDFSVKETIIGAGFSVTYRFSNSF
ncbi:hypothetical protein [Salinimicrobium sp. HB62]|uniref:hypothetical protein n=1 Tax=Salinimicrobium sp. HB62 TaxID=3077781 RepID=UPI002D798D6D|nr:hypothetical protein [Salinimicrobium sp. HB62]